MSPHPKRENAEEGGEQGEDGGRGEQETQAAEPGRVPRMGQVWGGGGGGGESRLDIKKNYADPDQGPPWASF